MAMKSGSRWASGAGRQAASGPALAPSGRWWGAVLGRQSWLRRDWAEGGAGDEGEGEGGGGGCLQGAAGGEGGDGGYVAAVVEEAAAGGWLENAGGGCHPARGSAHRQVVHGGARSPGSPDRRSSHPLLWSRLLHLSLPSEPGGGDLGGMRHGEPSGGRQEEDPVPGEAQEKSGGGPGPGVAPAPPQAVRAWPCGPRGSR